MDLITWVWMIVAAVFLIGEMLTAGFFLLVFGVGAIGAALVSAFGGSVLWQWIAFVVLSTIAFGFSRKFAKKVHRGPEDYGVGAERYTGMKAWVIETIDKAAATGMVRVDREEWRADSIDGEIILEGNWVEVEEVDGTRLIVKMSPADQKSSESTMGEETDRPADPEA